MKKPKLPPEPPAPASAAQPSENPSPTPEPTQRPKPDPSIEVEEFLASFPDTPTAKARKLFARSELATMRRKPEESAKYLNELADSVQPEDLSPMLLGKVGDLKEIISSLGNIPTGKKKSELENQIVEIVGRQADSRAMR